MEQGEIDRFEAFAENQCRLVDPDQASENLSPRRTTKSLFCTTNHQLSRTFCLIISSISPHQHYRSKQIATLREWNETLIGDGDGKDHGSRVEMTRGGPWLLTRAIFTGAGPAAAVNIWELPDVISVTPGRLRRLDPPRRIPSANGDLLKSEAIVIEVHLSKPFPVRALGPALWIGDIALTAVETPLESDG